MADVLSVLRAVSEALLGREGTLAFAAGLVLSVTTLLVNRYLSRKRLSWQGSYDSKIGLDPYADNPNPKFNQVLSPLRYVSVVVVHIRNSGRAPISTADYNAGLRLKFQNRYILDFRVSNPTSEDIRDEIGSKTYVCDIIENLGVDPKIKTGREQLRADLSTTLGLEGEQPAEGRALTDEDKKHRRQLVLPRVDLDPGVEFTLLVDLYELHPVDGGEVSKGYTFVPKMASVKVVDVNKKPKKITPNRLLLWLSLLLAGALVILILLQIVSPEKNPRNQLYCSGGATRLVGSTAFQQVTKEIARAYVADCTNASITVTATGSLEGVRELKAAANADELGSLSDGAVADSRGFPLNPLRSSYSRWSSTAMSASTGLPWTRFALSTKACSQIGDSWVPTSTYPSGS